MTGFFFFDRHDLAKLGFGGVNPKRTSSRRVLAAGLTARWGRLYARRYKRAMP